MSPDGGLIRALCVTDDIPHSTVNACKVISSCKALWWGERRIEDWNGEHQHLLPASGAGHTRFHAGSLLGQIQPASAACSFPASASSHLDLRLAWDPQAFCLIPWHAMLCRKLRDAIQESGAYEAGSVEDMRRAAAAVNSNAHGTGASPGGNTDQARTPDPPQPPPIPAALSSLPSEVHES